MLVKIDSRVAKICSKWQPVFPKFLKLAIYIFQSYFKLQFYGKYLTTIGKRKETQRESCYNKSTNQKKGVFLTP